MAAMRPGKITATGRTPRRQIAAWIEEVLATPEDAAVQKRVRGAVEEMGRAFPAPANAG